MPTKELFQEIERFLSEHWDRGETAFGQQSCGNSKIVERLRAGGTCTLDTAAKIHAFMAKQIAANRKKKRPSRRTGVAA